MRRLKVKLITLPWELEVPTLGLASLAAVTPPQFDVAIVDLLRQHLFFDEPVDLVGISASTPRINAAYALADLYRARGVKVVMGGHHVTALPDEGLSHADAVVVGEGETSWVRICEQFLMNPSLVGGLYRDPPPDLARLPQPRVDLMHIDRYGSFYYPLIASRGCPEACSFCFAKKMTRGYRTYPIAHVLEQVRRRPKFIDASYFVDDNLPADPDYARELFRGLKGVGLRFGMQARHEFAQSYRDVELAREAGCLLISSGYESVSQKTLDQTAKHATVEENREAIANTFRAGVLPSGNWMFGFDTDTPDIFEQTLEFLDRSDLMHCSFTSEIPFPGTAAFNRYQREGRMLTQDYDRFVGKDEVVVRPLQMSPEALQAGIRRLALAFYSPSRCTRRAVRGLKNEKLGGFGHKYLRVPALLGLNYYQLWQWSYRMRPSLQWLYRRILSVNKYRYWTDFLRRSNYFSTEHALRNDVPELHSVSPFFHAQGFKRGRLHPLVPVRPEVERTARI